MLLSSDYWQRMFTLVIVIQLSWVSHCRRVDRSAFAYQTYKVTTNYIALNQHSFGIVSSVPNPIAQWLPFQFQNVVQSLNRSITNFQVKIWVFWGQIWGFSSRNLSKFWVLLFQVNIFQFTAFKWSKFWFWGPS